MLIIKSAIKGTKESQGLFHVIVETINMEHEVYLLLPITNRKMPLDVVDKKSCFSTLEDLASAIDALPINTDVYAAEPMSFFTGSKNIRRLSAIEEEKIKKLLKKEGQEK